MSQPILDNVNLHNELPIRLGSINDIDRIKGVPQLDITAMNELTSLILEDLAGEHGFINTYFSSENIRYRQILQSGTALDSAKNLQSQLDLPAVNGCTIPFTPIIALSGGPDSGLAARLCIEAYKNRPETSKSSLDAIHIITFHSKYFHSDDCARAEAYMKHFEREFSNEVPIRSFVLDYPLEQIESFLLKVIGGYELMHGKIQNLTESLTNAIISLPSEETGFHSSIDTANLTEYFLDEVTNGSNGGTNVSLFSGIPKTAVFQMCDQLDITKYLQSENSTTWENKAMSYFPDATALDYKSVFHAIDVVHYLAIIKEKTIAEIASLTQYEASFISNVFARMINYAKRRHFGGQEFVGDFKDLTPKNITYFKNSYARKYLALLSKGLGISSLRCSDERGPTDVKSVRLLSFPRG